MDVATLCLAIAAFLTSVCVALWQVREHRTTGSLTVALAVLREFREPKFAAVRHRVVTEIPEDACSDPTGGFNGLPERLQRDAKAVSHFYDHLGVLVAHGLVDRRSIVGFAGDPILHTWSVLEPFILGERALRNGEYQEYFEMLVAITRKTSPTKVRKRLMRKHIRRGFLIQASGVLRDFRSRQRA